MEDIKNAIAKNLPAEIRVQLLEKLSECDKVEKINERLINKNDLLQLENQRLKARLKLEIDFNEKEKVFQKKEIDFSKKEAVLNEREKWSQRIYESNLELVRLVFNNPELKYGNHQSGYVDVNSKTTEEKNS